ncbi:MAG: hypothetical protein NC543_04700 [bacterium]|nr:hypothetical protein [bacterium]MCM1374838.1 hypothetical protein [Muribaculum sp.]
MWHCDYAKEPFDMRLFALLCIRRLWVALAGAVAGLALVGGGYYLKNVTLGGVIPYKVDSKFYLEYAVDPSDQQPYSYFATFTWNDLLKSDQAVEDMLKGLKIPMTAQELTDSFEAELMSDLRVCYIHTVHENAETAREIARVAGQAMFDIGRQHKELEAISLVSEGEPQLVTPDVRTLRACILGGVLGIFFSVFGLGIYMLVEEKVHVPGTLAWRYDIPVAGYVSREGKPSEELASQLAVLLEGKHSVAVTAVDGELDLGSIVRLLEQVGKEHSGGELSQSYTAIPSLWQAPEAGEAMLGYEGIVLLAKADHDCGKAIEETLRLFGQLEKPVDAMVLVGADDRLIRHYRGIRQQRG